MLFALFHTALHLAHTILQRFDLLNNMIVTERVYHGKIPLGFYLSRDFKINPKVFVQWGQETAEFLRMNNFFNYGLFEFNESKTVFMRNIRLSLNERLYEISWPGKPYELTVEAFNSNTGRTSFDLTIRFYFDGDLVATLVRKMVYVSATTGKPIELPPEFIARNTAKSDIRFSLKKEAPDSAGETTLTVRPSDLDFNDHVGHPVYVDYLFDSAYHIPYTHLPSDLLTERIRTVDLEYKYPVVLGRELVVRSWDQAGDMGLEVNFVVSQRAELADSQGGEPPGSQLVCLGKLDLFDW